MNIINYEKINLDTDYQTELCDSFTITEEQALYLILHDKADAFNWLFSKEQIFDEFENFSDYEKQYAKENNANWYMCKDGDITPVWYLTDFWEFYNSNKLSEFDIKWKMLQKFRQWMLEDKFEWRILNKSPDCDEYIDIQNIKTLDVYRYEQTLQTDYAIIWTCLYNEFQQEMKKMDLSIIL